jgi:hypothetical protein
MAAVMNKNSEPQWNVNVPKPAGNVQTYEREKNNFRISPMVTRRVSERNGL